MNGTVFFGNRYDNNERERSMNTDKKFIDRLYTDHYQFVYRVAAGTLYSHIVQDIENCTQDVFVAAMRAHELDRHPNIKGWLGATAKNIARQYNRKYLKEKKRYVELDENIELDRDFIAEFEEQDAFDGYMRCKIFACFTDNERVLYKLRYVDHLKYSEIAELLNVSESALMTRNSRLVKKVKKLIADDVRSDTKCD